MKTIDVTVELVTGEEKVISLKRIPRGKLSEFILIYKKLLDAYVEHDASIGSIIADDKNWNLLTRACALVPTSPEGSLDIEEFADDYPAIKRIFFTDGDPTNEEEGFQYGIIARFNDLDFRGMVRQIVEKQQKAKTTKEA